MANKIELRRINRNLIYRCIHDSNEISRQEVASKTELSMPTVIQNLSELEARGLIFSDGVFESTGGRRAKVIRCIYDAAYAVGIDITQNHLTIVIVDLKGRIRWGGEREEFPYENTASYYDEVCARLMQLVKENGIRQKRILGVGISLPSIVDKDRNYVTYGHILNEPADISRCFEERLPFVVKIFNDANSAGYAETWNNSANFSSFYLMLSNSVGGATIRDGQIYYGDHCRSSEIGHVKIVPGGKKCYCGQEGCVNAYVSAKLLSDNYEGQLEEFFERLEGGDETCENMFSEYLDYLAITVTNIRMIFDCSIILGGYIGKFMDKYMRKLGERLRRLNPYEQEYTYVTPCRYKNEASAVGAALPFITEYIENV